MKQLTKFEECVGHTLSKVMENDDNSVVLMFTGGAYVVIDAISGYDGGVSLDLRSEPIPSRFDEEYAERYNLDYPTSPENIIRLELGLNTLDAWREFAQQVYNRREREKAQRQAEDALLREFRRTYSDSAEGKE